MSRERLVSQAGGFILLVVALIGCRGDPPPINQTVTVSSSSTAVTIPAEIQRIAVLYPHSSFRDYSAASYTLSRSASGSAGSVIRRSVLISL